MSDIQWILVILGSLFAMMNIWFMAWGIKVASSQVKVTIPLWPGVVAAALFIAAVLV